MENNDEYSCNHESKKRKIDEVISDNTENTTGEVIIKQEDECIEIFVKPSGGYTGEVIDVERESVEMDTTKDSALGNVTVIPLIRLKEVNNNQNNDHIASQTQTETVSWNVLIERIEQLEGNLVQKMGTEISALKKSWEENNCKCKVIHKKDVDDLTSKIDQLRQENAQQEQQKQLLMKEKTELQQILDKERAFKSQLSGMLNDNNWQTKTETIIKAEPTENSENKKEGERKLHMPLEVKKETEKNSKSHLKERKKDLKPKTRKRTFIIPNYIKDKMPRTLSPQGFLDEMRERDWRRYNIVIRGMRYSGAHFYDEIVDLLRRTTGLLARIVNYVIMDSYIVLQMESLPNKYAILSRKDSLRSTGVSIYNDLTTRENQVQSWLHEVARHQEKMGKVVEVRFLKLKVDGDWWIWNERKGDLVKDG